MLLSVPVPQMSMANNTLIDGGVIDGTIVGQTAMVMAINMAISHDGHGGRDCDICPITDLLITQQRGYYDLKCWCIIA